MTKFLRWNGKPDVGDVTAEVEEIVNGACDRQNFSGVEDTIQECRDELESAKENVESAEGAAEEASGRAGDADDYAKDARRNLDEIEKKIDSLRSISHAGYPEDMRRVISLDITSNLVNKFITEETEEHDPVSVLSVDKILDLLRGLKDNIFDIESVLNDWKAKTKE